MCISLRLFLVFLACTGFALTSACGGGSGDGGASPGPTTPFAGSYLLFSFSATTAPPRMGEAGWGPLDADGLGGATGTLTTNRNGTVTPSVSRGTWSTRIESDGRFYWQQAAVPGVDQYGGGLRADGSVGAVSSIFDGMDPAIRLVVRPIGSYDLGSLNGAYHLCAFRYDSDASVNVSFFGTLTFDGAGAGTRSASVNRDGVIGVALFPTLVTYDVNPQGLLTLQDAGTGDLRGVVAAGGDLVLAAGSATAGEQPVLYALVRKGAAASLATLTGTYDIVGLQYGVGVVAYRSLSGRAVADGAGNMTVTFTTNTEGVIGTEPAQAVTYTVAPNGALVIATGGPEQFRGGVSPGGEFGILGGADAVGTDPAFYFLVR